MEGNESAFPIVMPDFVGGGLTKREYFAAMAMQGLIARGTPDHMESWDDLSEWIAEGSVKMADALIKELNRI